MNSKIFVTYLTSMLVLSACSKPDNNNKMRKDYEFAIDNFVGNRTHDPKQCPHFNATYNTKSMVVTVEENNKISEEKNISNKLVLITTDIDNGVEFTDYSTFTVNGSSETQHLEDGENYGDATFTGLCSDGKIFITAYVNGVYEGQNFTGYFLYKYTKINESELVKESVYKNLNIPLTHEIATYKISK